MMRYMRYAKKEISFYKADRSIEYRPVFFYIIFYLIIRKQTSNKPQIFVLYNILVKR